MLVEFFILLATHLASSTDPGCGANEYMNTIIQGCICVSGYKRRYTDDVCIPERTLKLTSPMSLPGCLGTTSFLLSMWVKTSAAQMAKPETVMFLYKKRQIKLYLDASGNYVINLQSEEWTNHTYVSTVAHTADTWTSLVLAYKLGTSQMLYGYSNTVPIFSEDLTAYNIMYSSRLQNFTVGQNCDSIKYFRAVNTSSCDSACLSFIQWYGDEIGVTGRNNLQFRYDLRESEGSFVWDIPLNSRSADLPSDAVWIDDRLPVCDPRVEVYDSSVSGTRKCAARTEKAMFLKGYSEDYWTLPTPGYMIDWSVPLLFQVWIKPIYPTTAAQPEGVFALGTYMTCQVDYDSGGIYVKRGSNTVSAACNMNAWQNIQVLASNDIYYIFIRGQMEGGGKQSAVGMTSKTVDKIHMGFCPACGHTNGFYGYIRNVIVSITASTEDLSSMMRSNGYDTNLMTAFYPVLYEPIEYLRDYCNTPSVTKLPASAYEWVEDTDPPVICYANMVYDSATNSCIKSTDILCAILANGYCARCDEHRNHFGLTCYCDSYNPVPDGLYCHDCVSYCKTCSSGVCSLCQYNLELVDGHCLCPSGTALPSSTAAACVSTCGDGMRHASEACDDGNGDSGDGCSSACEVEEGYICSGGSGTSADVCTCAPEVSSASYANDWTTINFVLTLPILAQQDCAAIFEPSTLSVLGTEVTCSTSDTDYYAVTLALGTNAGFDPFVDPLVLAAGAFANRIHTSCLSSGISILPTPLAPPYDIMPSFAFSASISASGIKATLSNAKSGSEVFQRLTIGYLMSSSVDVTEINSYLTQSCSGVKSLDISPSMLLNNTAYILTAWTKNFVGNVHNASSSASYSPTSSVTHPNTTDPSDPVSPSNSTTNTTQPESATESKSRHFPLNALLFSLLLGAVAIGLGFTWGRRLEKREKTGLAVFDQRAHVQNRLFGKESAQESKVAAAPSEQQIRSLELSLSIRLGRDPNHNLNNSLDVSKVALQPTPSPAASGDQTSRDLVTNRESSKSLATAWVRVTSGPISRNIISPSSTGTPSKLDGVKEAPGEENPEEFRKAGAVSPDCSISQLTAGKLLDYFLLICKVSFFLCDETMVEFGDVSQSAPVD